MSTPDLSRSRPASTHSASHPTTPTPTPFPAFQSSLTYALVRDFAYPAFHPMHYGAPPDPPSGTTTPGSEWNGARRLSDPLDVANTSSSQGGTWGAGAWYDNPESLPHLDGGIESLPSTSFGDEEGGAEGEAAGGRRKHRKSRSYANMTDFERGRRRESAGYRRSRTSQDAGLGGDMFHFQGGSQRDQAGRDTLRQSRSYGQSQQHRHSEGGERGSGRRDSHFATSLPHRRHASQQAGENGETYDEDTTIPLDLTAPTSPSHSPQRTSMVPEDEELYAGQSLVLYDFEPENANELGLKEGQVIMVSYRHGQGWLVAEDPLTGEQGLVPEAYVRLLSDLPHYNKETGTFDEVPEEEMGADEEEEVAVGTPHAGDEFRKSAGAKEVGRVDSGQ